MFASNDRNKWFLWRQKEAYWKMHHSIFQNSLTTEALEGHVPTNNAEKRIKKCCRNSCNWKAEGIDLCIKDWLEFKLKSSLTFKGNCLRSEKDAAPIFWKSGWLCRKNWSDNKEAFSIVEFTRQRCKWARIQLERFSTRGIFSRTGAALDARWENNDFCQKTSRLAKV